MDAGGASDRKGSGEQSFRCMKGLDAFRPLLCGPNNLVNGKADSQELYSECVHGTVLRCTCVSRVRVRIHET